MVTQFARGAQRMELTHLKYFQAVAQSGSLTRAARILGVSQPTLTVAMRNLEEGLHTTLLLREHNGVSLTATGKELLSHVSDIFARLERAEQMVAGLETQDTGSFTLGCHESLGAYFLPGFMKRFLERAPKVTLSLWNGTSRDVQQAVLERRVDFGLVVNPAPLPDLVLTDLFPDAVDIMVEQSTRPKDLDLEGALERVRKSPLILAGRVEQCQRLLDALAALGAFPARLLQCGDLELVKSLALAGLGVALLPRRVAHYGHPGRMVRLHQDLPCIPDTIALAYRADMHRTRAALLLKDELVAFGRALA